MSTSRNLALFLIAGAFIAGCNKVSNKKTPGGMPYKVFKGKGGTAIRTGDFIKVNLIQEIRDSVYFSTQGKPPMYMRVNETTTPYDLSEIWTQVKSGDSIVATQMMDTFIARNPGNVPPQFKKGDRILTFIKVLNVFKSDSAARQDNDRVQAEWLIGEIREVEKYLADKNIKTQRTPSGAFVEFIEPGTGKEVDSGKYVLVNYTGTSFSGKRFDSTTDTAFNHVKPYGYYAGMKQMIKGFDEAVLMMRVGTKARVYIPSSLAYGGNPTTRDILPYEHLIFDIEIVDLMDKMPEADTQPRPGPQ
jgi:FKBP-type peptidyl-prolyl cis-trans isomerase FkpA